MKILAFTCILSVMMNSTAPQMNFLGEQKTFARVRTAIADKEPTIVQTLSGKGLQTDDLSILMVAYKNEDELEVYARKKAEVTYRKLTSYKICARSGELGPKRKSGDLQVPEGFYHINVFNPTSNFFLSLGINYPNLSDKRKTKHSNPGGNIFIHGACATIGCLPMTDDKIKEIYLYAVHAKNNGQKRIPVYIFPFKMTDDNFKRHEATYTDNQDLVDFWKNLKKGYDKFSRENRELTFTIDQQGNYVF